MKRITTPLLIFLLLTVTSALVKGQETYVVNATNLNVRETPSLKAAVLGQLTKGAVVSVIDSDNPTWWKISYYGTEGYVEGRLRQWLRWKYGSEGCQH